MTKQYLIFFTILLLTGTTLRSQTQQKSEAQEWKAKWITAQVQQHLRIYLPGRHARSDTGGGSACYRQGRHHA